MIFTPFTLKLTGILKKLFTIYILALSLSCVGQQSVENKLTSAHLNVKGTKVSLIPPSGFEISTSFAGFQKNELNASIMVIEMPGPFSEVSKGFTPEGFASQSVIIDTIVTYTINGLPGVLASGQQNAYGISQSLARKAGNDPRSWAARPLRDPLDIPRAALRPKKIPKKPTRGRKDLLPG